MLCVIPGTGIRAFGKCVYCLAKIGDEFYIEVTNDSLALKTVNSARSGFACFQFKKSFFNSFKTQNAISCKMLSKSLVSVFRGLPSLEKSVDYCTVDLNTKKDKITFVFHCKYGIKKTHQLGFEDCEALRAVYSKELATNRVTQCSKPMQEAMSSFPHSINEVTLFISSTYLQLSNYIDDQEDSYRVTKSKVTLYPDEFEDYHTDVDTCITFCLKELRAILTFTNSVPDPLAVQFETAGRPVIFSIEKNPLYIADFVLATLSDAETNQSQLTQPTKKPSSSKGIKSYKGSSIAASNRNGSRSSKSKKLSSNKLNDSSFPTSMSGIGMGAQTGNESSLESTKHSAHSSRSGGIGMEINTQTGNESLEPNNINNNNYPEDSDDANLLPDDLLLETIIVRNGDSDLDSDFVTQKDQSHSHSTRSSSSTYKDQSIQDSIIDTSSFLPSTPPPSKKFKSLFSVSDMFGGIQDSVTILAPDSDDEI